MATFLSAAWRNLVLANYAVSPDMLLPYLPAGTELDTWNDTLYVSLVGFMFNEVRVLGVPIPFHTDFEEVNLRFYVRRKEGNEWKRGVVFIKEIVPKAAISFVANTLYKEHYVTLPMSHRFEEQENQLLWEYAWESEGNWNKIQAVTEKYTQALQEGSEAEFITEHFWGYTQLSAKKSSEYQVAHPRWDIYPVKSHFIDCNVAKLYGEEFHKVLQGKPISVFVAKGSDIKVKSKTLIQGNYY